MSQLTRKWITNEAVDATKIDPTDTYTMANLTITENINVDGTVFAPIVQSSNIESPNVLFTDATITDAIINDATINNLTVPDTGEMTVFDATISYLTVPDIGNLTVNGGTTLSGLTVNDVASFNDNVYVDDFQVDTGYTATFLGPVIIGNDIFPGYGFTVETDSTFHGDSTFYNNVEIHENLLVDVDSSFGGSVNTSGNVTIGGQLFADFTTAPSYLSNIQVQNGCNIYTGNLSVSSVSSGQGELTVEHDASIMSGNLWVGEGTVLSQDATVTRNLKVGNETSIGGLLLVGSDTTVIGNLSIIDNATIGEKLIVVGTNSEFERGLIVNGTVNQTALGIPEGNLNITTGDASVAGNIYIGGNVGLAVPNGNILVEGSGPSQINNLEISSGCTLETGTLSINGGGIISEGDTSFTGNLNVNGNVNFIPEVDNETAFVVNNAEGSQLLTINTINNILNFNSNVNVDQTYDSTTQTSPLINSIIISNIVGGNIGPVPAISGSVECPTIGYGGVGVEGVGWWGIHGKMNIGRGTYTDGSSVAGWFDGAIRVNGLSYNAEPNSGGIFVVDYNGDLNAHISADGTATFNSILASGVSNIDQTISNSIGPSLPLFSSIYTGQPSCNTFSTIPAIRGEIIYGQSGTIGGFGVEGIANWGIHGIEQNAGFHSDGTTGGGLFDGDVRINSKAGGANTGGLFIGPYPQGVINAHISADGTASFSGSLYINNQTTYPVGQWNTISDVTYSGISSATPTIIYTTIGNTAILNALIYFSNGSPIDGFVIILPYVTLYAPNPMVVTPSFVWPAVLNNNTILLPASVIWSSIDYPSLLISFPSQDSLSGYVSFSIIYPAVA